MKDFDNPAYWDRFARNALGANDRPTPTEAGETVLRLMRELNETRKRLEDTEREARVALSALRAPLMEAANKVDEAVNRMASRFSPNP